MRLLGALAVILLVVGGYGYGESRFFRSNSIGMPFEELTEYRSDEFTYVLKLEDQPNGQNRILLKNGEEHKRWFTKSKGQLEIVQLFVDGVLVSETHSSNGRITKETQYSDGVVVSTSDYRYRNDVLISVTTRDGLGEVISENYYERTSGGKLRSVVSDNDGVSSMSYYVYGGENIVEEWHGQGDDGDLLRYSGRELISEETWGEEGILTVTEYDYGDVTVSRYLDFAAGIEEFVERDTDDRILFLRRVDNGVLVEERDYQYEGEFLVSTRTRTPLNEELTVFQYKGEELHIEEIYRNGDLTMVRTYDSDDSYHEDMYQDGSPFIRFLYYEGVRVEEQEIGTQ